MISQPHKGWLFSIINPSGKSNTPPAPPPSQFLPL
nr:MAG TPA: hypothetical protein [Caudoviricetes sp.]